MNTKQTSNSVSEVERDPRLFTWFLTLVMGIVYVWTLIANTTLRQPLPLGIFTILLIVYVLLHWQIETLIKKPKLIFWYLVLQGTLAFIICVMANQIAIVFALYLAMLGETVGIFGLTRQGLLAAAFYLLLAFINTQTIMGPASAGLTLLGITPVIIFIVIYVTLYRRQAEAREQAQILASELETANRQLSEYAARVEDLTIANERQRMARELHDTLSQGLAGLILQLEAADAHLVSNHNDKARVIVANAMIQARTTLSDARRAIDDLRKTSADDLDSALRLEISRFTEATGIPCIFQADQISSPQGTPPLADTVQETVIRAVAEGLTNAARHAQAQQVAVNVGMKDKNLLVTIQDDGQGFDADSIPSGHYGLLGIRERVRLANGTFEIQSDNGKGTTLKIEIPL